MTGERRRNDPAAATIADLAADIAGRGLAFEPPEPVPDAFVRDTQPMLIVTANEVPGHRIVEVHGDVFGLVVRARNFFSNLGQLEATAGGEVVAYPQVSLVPPLLVVASGCNPAVIWLTSRNPSSRRNDVPATRNSCSLGAQQQLLLNR